MTILLCELLVRLVIPQQLIIERPDVWYPVPGLGWQKRADVDTTINSGERTVRIRTDRYGFRIGQAGRSPAEFNVLLLGDSLMEAIQVEYEDSLAGLLELQLAERLETGVAVWNTAVAGWGPSQYLIQARDALALRQFDLVLVCLFLGNDAEADRITSFPPRPEINRHSFRYPRKATWKEFVRAVMSPANDLLERRSHLFQLVKVRHGRS